MFMSWTGLGHFLGWAGPRLACACPSLCRHGPGLALAWSELVMVLTGHGLGMCCPRHGLVWALACLG